MRLGGIGNDSPPLRLSRIHAVNVSRGAAESAERERGDPKHSNVGNHSPNGDSPNLRPRGPFSATSAAPREPIPVFNRMETSQRENRFEVSGAETGGDLAQRRRDAEERGCGWVESEMRPNLSASAPQRENRFEVSGAETGTDLAQRRRDAEKRGCGWVESEVSLRLSASASQRENRFAVSGAETGTGLAQRRRDAEERGCGWVESEVNLRLCASASQRENRLGVSGAETGTDLAQRRRDAERDWKIGVWAPAKGLTAW